MHWNWLNGWNSVFLGVATLGAAATGELASNSQTIIVVSGEIIVAIITGYCLIKVGQLKSHINSRMDELLALTRAAANAEGIIEGRKREKLESITK